MTRCLYETYMNLLSYKLKKQTGGRTGLKELEAKLTAVVAYHIKL